MKQEIDVDNPNNPNKGSFIHTTKDIVKSDSENFNTGIDEREAFEDAWENGLKKDVWKATSIKEICWLGWKASAIH